KNLVAYLSFRQKQLEHAHHNQRTEKAERKNLYQNLLSQDFFLQHGKYIKIFILTHQLIK
ncbi:TPA: hypothetical protein ACF5TL_004733, partial [Escherichia coli]